MKKRATAAALLVLPLFAVGECGTAGAAGARPASPASAGRAHAGTDSVTLNGAGANSVAPFYETVFAAYEKANSGVTINYSPAGSSVGVKDIEAGTVNFGDSEIPMASSDLQTAQKSVGNVLQFPVDLGGVAISYNVPGAPQGLKLNGQVLAGIFDGSVTNWDDPLVAKATGVTDLPDLPIIPVHRSDTSGPGWDLDQYLIDTSPTWVKKTGTSTPSKAWPLPDVGIGEDLNTGVATYIAQTKGSIGYVEYAYARKAGFDNAWLLNASGKYVQVDFQTLEAAAKSDTHLSWSNFNIVYSKGATAYPLANYSWALVNQKQSDTATGEALKALFTYVVTTGQKVANPLGYAKLPGVAVSLATLTLSELEGSNGKVLK
jgi:phosphate transport system substrate-binding protein